MKPHIFGISSRNRTFQAGFTLVEMMVVIVIIGIITTSLLLNFSQYRTHLIQSAQLMESQIRAAQSEAVSSTQYKGYNPCGYGIHYVSSTNFIVYAGPNASSTDCSTINRNYQSGYGVIASNSFIDSNIQFTGSFSDIYFEPPDPKTYLNNVFNLSQAPVTISIKVAGGSCPQDCKTINVYPSGKIETP